MALYFAIFHSLAAAAASITKPMEVSPLTAPRRRSPSNVQYRPVAASRMRDHEVRHRVGGTSTGDFISNGLSGLTSMVDEQYGLRKAESFYWGPEGNPLANLTAYVGEQAVRVLSMERFDRVLDNAECTPTSVKLKFKKEAHFDQIQSEWAWVDQQDDNYIVLVTENARCNMPDGDDTVRQPWHVKHIDFDDDTNVVTLAAEPKSWETAFDHWNLRVSSQSLLPPSEQALQKRIGIDETTSISLAADFTTNKFTLSNADTNTAASLTCDPCYSTGALDFDIDVTWYLFSGLEGYVTMTPNDIGAYINFDIGVDQEIGTALSKQENLFTYAPNRFSIGGIMDFGPAFKVNIEATIGKASAKVAVKAGVDITIPADSIATLDFDDSDNNEWTGWTPQFTPHVDNLPLSSELALSASIGTVLRLEFDAQVLSWGLSAGLGLSAPTITMELSGVSGEDVCDVPDNAFGTEFDVNLGYSLDLFAGFGKSTDMPGKMNLAGGQLPLYSTCLPVEGTAPTASAVPSSSAAPYPMPGNDTFRW